MITSPVRFLGIVFLVVLSLVGCSDSKKLEVGFTCLLNSDCSSGLICTIGKCHAACKLTTDCPLGQNCVKAGATAMCQLPSEAECRAVLCAGVFVCASDFRCRTGCQGPGDCLTGQNCVSGVCADTVELDVNGKLPQKNPNWAPDAGTNTKIDATMPIDVPDAPVVTIDAPIADTLPVNKVDVATLPIDAPNVPVVTIDAPIADTLPANTVDVAPACSGTCDDGLLCTTDTCTTGLCQSTLKTGYCLIAKTCFMDGDQNPTDSCKTCTMGTSTSDWTVQPEGARCGAGKSCQSGVCTDCGNIGQPCCGAGTPKTCSVGAMCETATGKCKADKAIDISGGGNTFCALFQSGQVRCWGSSGKELGINNPAGSNVALPPNVLGIDDAVQLSVGFNGSCAVRATGAVICWGNPVGTASTFLPVAVPGISNAKQVSIGIEHVCVRTADSKIQCWGDNSNGQFGNGTKNTSATPMQMLDVTEALKVVACGNSTCVLTRGGQVLCAGAKGGNGQTTEVSTPTNVLTVSNPLDLTCSTNFMNYVGDIGNFCAVNQARAISCWGGTNDSTPSTVVGLGQVRVMAITPFTNGIPSYLAIQEDYSIWALGDNSHGQLGDGTFVTATYHTSPRLAHVSTALGGVVAVATNAKEDGIASCLLLSDGSISCSGYGANLGDGQIIQAAGNRALFVPVVGVLPVVSENGQCYDGFDNDGNGKADLADPACAQDLGSVTGNNAATVSFAGMFGNYLGESCNLNTAYPSAGNFGGPEAVLTWTAPASGTYQFDTTGSSFDTVLAAFKGNPQTSTELGCNDDGAVLPNGASMIQVPVTSGDKLTIVVDSKAIRFGSDRIPSQSFNLNITKM